MRLCLSSKPNLQKDLIPARRDQLKPQKLHKATINKYNFRTLIILLSIEMKQQLQMNIAIVKLKIGISKIKLTIIN